MILSEASIWVVREDRSSAETGQTNRGPVCREIWPGIGL